MTSKNFRECVDYFRNQAGFKRIFLEMRKKWESYGRLAGRVKLRKASEEEIMAIEGLLGKRISRNESGEIIFSLKEFEEALSKTRFEGVPMKALLDGYFGEEIVTKKATQAKNEREESEFFHALVDKCKGEIIRKTGKGEKLEENMALKWFEDMVKEKRYGYFILKSEWAAKNGDGESLGINTFRAVSYLTSLERCEEIPLAVLGAKFTSNPHYFDRGSNGGKLLVSGLAYIYEMEFPARAYEWRQLLEIGKVAADHVSNTVTAFGVHILMGAGERPEDGETLGDGVKLHPAYEEFIKLGEPYTVTSYNLKGVCGAYCAGGKVYAVENEMVFTYLVDKGEKLGAGIICTSGQMRTAALRLIDMLCEKGMEIYYGGDLDPEGLVIADKLWNRHPENVKLWHMDTLDYEMSISDETIGGRRLEMIKMLKNPVLKCTGAAILEKKKAGYQENILEKFLEDMQKEG